MEINQFIRETLMEKVRDLFNVTFEEMTSNKRKQHFVYARILYWSWCYKLTQEHSASLGKMFGRNHSTVLHGMKQHKNLLFSDKDYKFYNTEMEKHLVRRGIIKENIPVDVILEKKEKAVEALSKYTPPSKEQFLMSWLVNKQAFMRDLYC